MADVTIRPATLEDAADLAPRLRAADRAEVWASHRATPIQALETSVRLSCSDAWAGLADGALVCLWGVVPLSLVSRIGSPWLLASDDLERHQVAFLRRCRGMVDQMQAPYRLLTNHVDARNRLSIRWLRWMGFEIAPVAPWGPDGLPFHRFERRAS